MKYLLLILVMLNGCASVNVVQQKRDQVLNCIKDLKSSDIESNDAYEICRQVYRLKKLKE